MPQLTPADTKFKIQMCSCWVEVPWCFLWESQNASANLITTWCDHENCKCVIDCITEVNGESKHFFVATQDTDLRRYLQKISGIPLIYALRNALFLEQPSPFPHQFVKSVEEEHLYMTDMKYNDNAKHKDMWCGWQHTTTRSKLKGNLGIMKFSN